MAELRRSRREIGALVLVFSLAVSSVDLERGLVTFRWSTDGFDHTWTQTIAELAEEDPCVLAWLRTTRRIAGRPGGSRGD